MICHYGTYLTLILVLEDNVIFSLKTYSVLDNALFVYKGDVYQYTFGQYALIKA